MTAEKDYKEAMRLKSVGGDGPMFEELLQEEAEFYISIMEGVNK